MSLPGHARRISLVQIHLHITEKLAMFSEGEVTSHPAQDASLVCVPIDAGLCASAYEEEMLQTSQVVP